MLSAVPQSAWTPARTLRVVISVAVAYYLGVRIGLALTMPTQPISTLWPPNAILLAALLLTPTEIWWLVLVAAFPAHLAGEWFEGIPLRMVLCWFISNCSEALIGACLFRSVYRSPRLDSLKQLAVFVVAGVLLAPLLSSFLDAAFVTWNRFGSMDYSHLWRTRVFSNALATMTLVPVIVQVATVDPVEWWQTSRVRFLEGGTLTVGLLDTCVLIFTHAFPQARIPAVLLFAPFPFLLWAGVRFGPGGAAATLLVLALFSVWATIHAQPPFDTSSPRQNALLLQLFLLFTEIPMLTLGAAMAERRRGEQALRRSEERFAVAFRASPDALAIVRRSDGTIVDVNERWAHLFGINGSTAIGHTPLDLKLFVHPADGERVTNHLATRGHLRDIELQLHTRHNTMIRAVVTAESVSMAEEQCFLIVVRDVTDRRRAEMQLMQHRAEIAHLGRVALLGELSAAIAHELNQPLAAIMANARAGQRLMSREPADAAEVCNILEDIVSDDRRASEVIHRLQALLKRGELQLQPLDINEVVREVVDLVHTELIRREVLLHTVLSPDLPRVPADRVQMQQVLMNLVFNACEAMGEQPREERNVTIVTRATSGGEVAIAVADQGSGIPDGKEEQLFEAFYTSKRHGLGLGLTICRTIVAAHGGALWAANNPDRGATFHIVLRGSSHAA
jgi:two-component system sensor kinase FixL